MQLYENLPIKRLLGYIFVNNDFTPFSPQTYLLAWMLLLLSAHGTKGRHAGKSDKS